MEFHLHMDSILYLNSRVNQIFSCCKSVVSQVAFCPIAACVAASLHYASLRSNTNKFFIFRVNLQLLKLQFPLGRSYLHLNLYFRSSHHLQLSYHCSDPNFFDELARKPFLRRLTLCQIALASARKPYRVSVPTRERSFRCDLCNGAKLRGLNLTFFYRERTRYVPFSLF